MITSALNLAAVLMDVDSTLLPVVNAGTAGSEVSATSENVPETHMYF